MSILPQENSIIELVEGEPRVSHRVIAEHTSNKEVSVRNLINKYRERIEKIGNLHFKNEGLKRATKDGKSRGKVQNVTYFLNEPQSTFLMTLLKNSETVVDFKFRLVDDFFKMRKLLENQNFSGNPRNEILQLEKEMIGLKTAIDILRPSEASKIGMTKTLYKDLDLRTLYLPEYSDENHTYSAKALLEKFGIKISVQQFNKEMILAGLLEIKTRRSSKYLTEKDEDGNEIKIPLLKEFKSLTEKGLKFGKNLISPKNQLESQPHYFEKSFPELLQLLKI
ncbi:putative phage-encoded protein [Thiovulum sp. ES]|nr:putative phage-encoded protein [Thiovulum sp. ES]